MNSQGRQPVIKLKEGPVFKYTIGQQVFQMDRNGEDYIVAIVTNRTIINGHKVYQTDQREKWENESSIRI